MRSRAIIVMAVLGAALVTGGWLVEHGIAAGPAPREGVRLFDNVFTHIARYYVDPIDADNQKCEAVARSAYEAGLKAVKPGATFTMANGSSTAHSACRNPPDVMLPQ